MYRWESLESFTGCEMTFKIKSGDLVTLTKKGQQQFRRSNTFHVYVPPEINKIQPGDPMLVLKVHTNSAIGVFNWIDSYIIDFLVEEKKITAIFETREGLLEEMVVPLKRHQEELKEQRKKATGLVVQLDKAIESIIGKNWGSDPKGAARQVYQKIKNKLENK